MGEISIKVELLKKIKNREILIGVIGLGYVGLPLAVEGAKAGFRTIGFDVEKNKVDMVNEGINYILDVDNTDLQKLVQSGNLMATNDFSALSELDFIAICVPTPLDEHQQPYLGYVKNATKDIAKYLRCGMVVVLESTTYPGTTEDFIMPILENDSNLRCGKDFYLGFSPERVDPGNMVYNTKNTPKIVGAVGVDALDVIATMYRTLLASEVYTVSSPAVAEMEKLLENTYRNINIGMVNEFAMLCNHMNIDIWEVIEAAKTKPYGFQAFYPGPGLGGHCIPLDPYYLSWKAREYGFNISMIESSMIINNQMPRYVIQRISRILNRKEKALNGSNVLVLGVAFKKDIDDYRESPALRIIDFLERDFAQVVFYDPYVKEYNYKDKYYKGLLELTKQTLQEADIVVIITDHSCVDYNFIQRNAASIFDTRNAMKNINDRDNIETL